MEDLLALVGRLKSHQDALKLVHPLDAGGWYLALVHDGPGLIDDLSNIAADLGLKFTANRLWISAYVAIERRKGRRLQRDGPGNIVVCLPDVHRDQRQGQTVKNHDRLNHRAGKL